MNNTDKLEAITKLDKIEGTAQEILKEIERGAESARFEPGVYATAHDHNEFNPEEHTADSLRGILAVQYGYPLNDQVRSNLREPGQIERDTYLRGPASRYNIPEEAQEHERGRVKSHTLGSRRIKPELEQNFHREPVKPEEQRDDERGHGTLSQAKARGDTLLLTLAKARGMGPHRDSAPDDLEKMINKAERSPYAEDTLKLTLAKAAGMVR